MNSEILMRLMVMFDLPTFTKADRKAASIFRNDLTKLGFIMIQYSIYARIIKGVDKSQNLRQKILSALPPSGSVRLLIITDRQYDAMEILLGAPKTTSEIINGEMNLFNF